MSEGNVPCNGCTRCCRGDAIRILPDEDPAAWKTVPHPLAPGARMLAHKPNGDCTYLSDEGCSIQETKPRMCREMDCRNLASALNYTQARKLAKAGRLPIAVWQRGRDLLKGDK